MDEIPEDVKRAAEALAAKYSDEDMAYYGLVDLACGAILAEREACVSRFDEAGKRFGISWDHRDEIAAAIRTPAK